MCRPNADGGRRCPGNANRAAATSRKRISRARQTLTEARATNNTAAITEAQRRLHAATADHQHHTTTSKEPPMPPPNLDPHAQQAAAQQAREQAAQIREQATQARQQAEAHAQQARDHARQERDRARQERDRARQERDRARNTRHQNQHSGQGQTGGIGNVSGPVGTYIETVNAPLNLGSGAQYNYGQPQEGALNLGSGSQYNYGPGESFGPNVQDEVNQTLNQVFGQMNQAFNPASGSADQFNGAVFNGGSGSTYIGSASGTINFNTDYGTAVADCDRGTLKFRGETINVHDERYRVPGADLNSDSMPHNSTSINIQGVPLISGQDGVYLNGHRI